MQLSLESVSNVSILSAQGPIREREVAVLLAGIRKLFRDGKNRLVLELPDAAGMSSDHLRELLQLNLLAAELSGEIVLAGIDAATVTRIATFSSPPFLKTFASRALALAHFAPKVDAHAEIALSPKGATPAPASVTSGTRDEIRHRELNDLGALRKKIEQLESENRGLAEQLESKLFIYREPVATEQWEKKVEALESALNATLTKS